MIQKSIITPFAFNFSYNFHHVAYIDLYRFLTCLDKLYTGVVSLSLFSFCAEISHIFSLGGQTRSSPKTGSGRSRTPLCRTKKWRLYDERFSLI